MADKEAQRFAVLKASGSRFAYVQDTETPRTVARYDILRRYGKHDGWTVAKRHADSLNAEHPTPTEAADREEH